MQQDHADVSKALDMVLARIQEAIDDLNNTVIEASQAEDFERVQRLGEKGQQIIHFREDVLNLQSDWNRAFASSGGGGGPGPSGSLTPATALSDDFSDDDADMDIPTKQKEDFYVPILSVLVELGGQARAEEVLERLTDALDFNPRDLKPRPAGIPVRWMHTAHRARHDLVHEKGFLSASSPRGIWEITEAGRNYLARNAQTVNTMHETGE